MHDTRNMIFHAPYPLDRAAKSASGIRPVQMHDAFARLGYTVWPVTGYGAERRARIRDIERAMDDGTKFDFCYSESSTMPLAMTEPNHLPLHPFFDYAFFARLRKAGVRVGCFVRDIYWMFPDYRNAVHFPQREAALLAYRWDMHNYRTTLDRVYLPSMEMARYLSIDPGLVAELPPAHGWADTAADPGGKGVRLFYVGGLSAYDRLHRLFEAVSRVHGEGYDVSLTVCTPPDQWSLVKDEYAPLMSGGVSIVHGHGEDLKPFFNAANVGVCAAEPVEYWTFAVPVKLYDYLGAGKPILASQSTLTSEFVDAEDIGWSVPYEVDDLAAWLRAAAADPALIPEKRQQVLEARHRHTWQARAQLVADDLSQVPRRSAAAQPQG